MRIILFFLFTFSIIACNKGPVNNQPPAAVDTISTGWRKVMIPFLPSASDIFFINNTTGFVAAGNFIYRSTDGGNTWQKVYQSAGPIFVNIAMGSQTSAVFVPAQGNKRVFVTTNGGNSFDSVTINDNGLMDAFFVTPLIAYMNGEKCWKTTNGGVTWTSLSNLAGGGYRSLHFLNEQTGWSAGEGGLYSTTNGGVNWNPIATSNFNFVATGNVYFADANNGYITDNNSVGKTINGGNTWTKSPEFGWGYHDLHFLSASLGYITDGHYIYKTINGGANWTKEVRLASDFIIELHFTDANHGWATGGAGYVLKYE